jgi:hypothetical protein
VGGMTDQIIIYQSPDGTTGIEVHLEAETVWLTQKQMAELFDKDVRSVNEHIRNIFKEGELAENSVIRKFRITASDGKTYETSHYNLDVIISVGYRVKSHRGTQFRQWATRILRDHLVQGFTVNQARLAERGISEMQQAVELLARTLDHQALITGMGKDVLSVIVGYAKTWRLLLQYDEDTLNRGGFSLHREKKNEVNFVISYVKRDGANLYYSQLIFKRNTHNCQVQ